MNVQGPRGTKDITIQDSYKWQYVEDKIRNATREFGYREIRTPIFEHTELFLRGVGETTDVVQKEMYTFEDKGGRSITLRPEGTAGAVRSFIESGIVSGPQPTKMYYLSAPVFRYEAPQAGTYPRTLSPCTCRCSRRDSLPQAPGPRHSSVSSVRTQRKSLCCTCP